MISQKEYPRSKGILDTSSAKRINAICPSYMIQEKHVCNIDTGFFRAQKADVQTTAAVP